MTDREHERDLKPVAGAVYGLAGAGALALIVGLVAFAAPRPAGALPAYAQQTHMSCGGCHVNAAGGGERNAFGKAFAANGHKVSSAPKSGKTTKSGKATEPSKASVSGGATSSPTAGPPAPPFGYYLGEWPIVYDHVQAQAMSLDRPYYSHFLYDYCDYRNCVLRQDSSGKWGPVWYGPKE